MSKLSKILEDDFQKIKNRTKSTSHAPSYVRNICIWFKFERLSKISRFEWVVCNGARLVPGSDFVLWLGLKVSVRAVNKKPRTRN